MAQFLILQQFTTAGWKFIEMHFAFVYWNYCSHLNSLVNSHNLSVESLELSMQEVMSSADYNNRIEIFKHFHIYYDIWFSQSKYYLNF